MRRCEGPRMAPFSIPLVVGILLISCLGVNIRAAEKLEKDNTNLYADNDPVLSLEADGFYSNVSDSEKSWLILFYISWCGHCINYVSTYIEVAENLKGLSKYAKVSAINCATDANLPICRDHGIVGYPTVLFISRHTKNTTSPISVVSDEAIESSDSLVEFMLDKIRLEHPGVTLPRIVAKTPLGLPGDEGPASSNSPNIMITKHNSSVLYYEDLVYALRYSLKLEVSGHSDIRGGALLALKQYIGTLSKYFPDGDQRITDSLAFLNSALDKGRAKAISSTQWAIYLNESGILKHTESSGGLIRCQASRRGYRGYPCTLWSLFHTLTVQAATSLAPNSEEEDYASKLVNKKLSFHVLTAMKSYISHFFTCIECTTNFNIMAVEIESLEDKSNRDSVLWLWHAHNRVNKRLSGDGGGEDPQHPKVQFPDLKLCPLCKTPKGIWDEEVVYDFLQSIYTDIRHIDSPKLVTRKNAAIRKDAFSTGRSPQYVGMRWSLIGMNAADMSMCYAIYIISALVIAGLFYFIAVRQRLYLRVRRCPKAADQYTGLHHHKPIY